MKWLVACLVLVVLCSNSEARRDERQYHARHLSSHSWEGVPLKRHWKHQPTSQWNWRHLGAGWPNIWRRPWGNLGGWMSEWGDRKSTIDEFIPTLTPSNMILVTAKPDEKDGPNVCTYREQFPMKHFRPVWMRKHYRYIKKCCPGFSTVEGQKGCPKELINIIEEAKRQGLSDFVKALSSQNVTEVLLGDGPFTVFAPNNKAIKQFLDSKYHMNKKGLTKMMLLHHVVIGRIILENLRTESLETMHKEMLVDVTVSTDRKTIFVQGAKVLKHLVAKNAILYIIDRVISPPGETIAQFLNSRPEFSTLQRMVKESGFQYVSGVTLFAPTNDAFEKVDPNIFKQSCFNLRDFMKYHMVPGRLFLREVTSSAAKVQTIEGTLLNLKINKDRFTVEDATVEEADIGVFNGVIQIIDRVLLPTTALDVVKVAESLNATELVSLLRETKINELLQGSGNFTLFAPLNTAFQQQAVKNIFSEMSKAELERTLFFHGMDYILKLKDVRDDKLFDTLSPVDRMRTNVYKLGLKVTMNGVCLTHLPIQACNGLVYPIDEVLIPPKQTILELLRARHETHNFTILVSLIKKSNLTSLLSGPGPVTLFAPTDEAFTAAIDNKLINSMIDSKMMELLKYHMISRTVYSSALTPNMRSWYQILRYHRVIHIPSIQGKLLSFSWFNGYLRVNKVDVTESDVSVTNGVVHIIDELLKFP